MSCAFLILLSGVLLFSNFPILTAQEATSTPTFTPTPIQQPLPEKPRTLSDIQALLQTTDDTCQLPCFWGIRPDYTTEEDIVRFLRPRSIGNNAPELQFDFRDEQNQQSIFYISFGIENEIVSSMFLSLENPSEWLPPQTLELPNLLSIMPSTPSAYLSINVTTQRVFLTFAYDEGVLAQYVFELHEEGEFVSEAGFQFCPVIEQNYFIILNLQNDNIQALLEGYGIPLSISRNKTWTVERMTGMEIEEFINQITEYPDACIELPSYSELTEMGYVF